MADSAIVKLGRSLYNEGDFSILGAKHSESDGSYRVSIRLSRPLLPAELDGISAFISDELGSRTVKIEYDMEETLFYSENGFDPRLWGECVLAAWGQLTPEIKPILDRSTIELIDVNDSVVYRLDIPSILIKAVLPKYVSDIRAWTKENWGLNLTLNLNAVEMDLNELRVLRDVVKDSGRTPESVIRAREEKARSVKAVPKPKKVAADPRDIIIGREINRPNILKMSDIDEQSGNVTVLGSIMDIEVNETRDKQRSIVRISVTDRTNTIAVKIFPEREQAARAIKRLEEIKKDGDLLLVRGGYRYDNFSRDYVLFANDINKRDAEKRNDLAQGDKRVELHLHTQMSTMDGLTKVSDVVATAARWGHKAIAITDHGVVHALPEAMKAAKKNNIKVIFGCEGYLLDDCKLARIEGEYVIIAPIIAEGAGRKLIFELLAVRSDAEGNVRERFHTYVNPASPLPKWVENECGLTEDCLSDAPTPSVAVNKLMQFASGATLVTYDEETIIAIESVIDSDNINEYGYVNISKLDINMHLDIRDYSMEYGAAAHRSYDRPKLPGAELSDFLLKKFISLVEELRSENLDSLPLWSSTSRDGTKLPLYHIVLLAAELSGLKNLYKLVSYSHLEFYHKRPRMPRSLLYLHRKGMILGSACERGELFRAIINKLPEDEQVRIADWYDYLEIQPIANNAFMIRNGIAEDDEELKDFNRRILQIGDELNKTVVATGDVHFLNPEDAIFRSILMHAHGFTDAEQQAPLYFRTTDDMMNEFMYLGEDRAYDVVVKNPNEIAERCVQLHPFLDERTTYSPELPGAKEDLYNMSMGEAHRRYGDPLPEIVQKRLDKELKSIIGNGYSSLYMVAQKLVSKSMGDGYLVGSRGSVGSSFVATMLGITEVNALPPHYLCPNCKHSEFMLEEKSRCGIDLPDKLCEKCGTKMKKEGYDIPFEVFLGFKGDKTPDIDLNFSGEYQPVAHRFTEEMFGAGHAFRAGTISAVQDKTVYGYVKHYCDDVGMNVSEAEANRLVSGCLGVKKTTGQHPGGIVIVPEDYEIFDFCPVQHPADKMDSGSVTTHFDFHALDDRLVKLDILGHDDPTALRMLKDLTGLDPRSIPLDDEPTMEIYRADVPLGISLETLGCDVGSLGIPEFGTNFVRGMLMETRPTTMEELVRIAGLSHGTDVWNNNAQLLVQDGTATLMEVICTRDDIMNYLISVGGDPSLSFKTMESVRKGRGLTPEMETAMNNINVPSWFIDSCKKIQYMFPRAHAAAYVMMSFRIAYYKVHHPLEYYAVYFTVRADTFDIEQAYGGLDKVMERLTALKQKDRPDTKEKDAIVILEIVAEMNMRGIELLPVDIYKSRAKTFVIEDGKIRPPFTSIAGLGENVAMVIEKAAEGGEYLSREDFVKRTKTNTAIMEKLERLGCLDGLPETNQIKMF